MDESDVQVSNEMANRMSLFYAYPTPMLKTLSDATSKFVSEVSLSIVLCILLYCVKKKIFLFLAAKSENKNFLCKSNIKLPAYVDFSERLAGHEITADQ